MSGGATGGQATSCTRQGYSFTPLMGSRIQSTGGSPFQAVAARRVAAPFHLI